MKHNLLFVYNLLEYCRLIWLINLFYFLRFIQFDKIHLYKIAKNQQRISTNLTN